MKKKISLRMLAAILALAMLVATGVTTVTALELPDVDALAGDQRETIGITNAEIVAKYSFISAKEKNILNCKAIAGATHSIPAPMDSDNLVAIDAENQTVAASTFTQAGYTWTPVKAYLVYTDAANVEQKIPVALDANGNGSFRTDLESYSIEVEYEVRVAIDLDAQKLLANTPSLLANAIINLNKLSTTVLGDLETVASDLVFDSLLELTKPITFGNTTMTPFGEGTAGYFALMALKENRDANGGTFGLVKEINAYKASAYKVGFVSSNGVAIKNAYDDIADDISTMAVEYKTCIMFVDAAYALGSIDATTYNNLKTFEGIIDKLSANLKAIPAANWEYANYTLIKRDATALELEALNLAVMAALNETGTASFVGRHDDAAFVEAPVAATTSVKAGVAQSMVNVTVNAQVIGASTTNSNTLTTISGKTTNFLMKDGSTEDEINAKIASVGICADTLAYWTQNASEYNIDSEFYAPVTTSFERIPETGVTNVTITYVPVTFDITTNYGGDRTVYYGYRLKLANHTDSTKSYDYKVNGVAKYQGEIIKVAEDLNIVQTEGTALVSSTIPAIIAESSVGAALSAEARNVLKANAFKAIEYPNLAGSLRFRVPTIAQLEAVGSNGYKVTATPAVSGLLSGAIWTADSVDLLDANGRILESFDMTNNSVEFPYDGSFENARVNFSLIVTDIAEEDAIVVANIPHALATDAVDQLAVLNRMADGNLYTQLSSLTSGNINLIVTVVNASDMSEGAKTSVSRLKSDCVDASGNFLLYKYLTDYKTAKAKGEGEALKYYYTGNNAANIKKQLDVLSAVFNALCPANPTDEVSIKDKQIFIQLLTENGLDDYVTKLDSIREAVDECKDIAPVNQYVDTNSAALGALATAVIAAKNKTAEYTGNGVVDYTESIMLAAPDKSTVNIFVNILKGDGTTETRKDSVTLSNGEAVGNLIKNKFEALDAQLTINKNYYDVAGVESIPTGNVTIDSITSDIVITYTPFEYTVVIPGVADQIFSYDMDWTITLPAPSSNNTKYVYHINGDEIEVVTEAVRYTFDSLNVFGSDRVYEEIEIESIDLESEKLLNFVDLMNTAFADMGAKLIPVQDANGNIIMVFRASNSISSAISGDVMTNLATALTLYENVELGGSLFWDGTAVHLQAMTDMVASGGFTLDTLCDIIAEDGSVINDAVLGQLTPMIDPEGNIGGKLMTSTINIDGRTMSFYVTLSDTMPASMLAKMRSAVVTVKDYFTIECVDGKFNFIITAPDSIYPYYLAQMLVSGNVDITDISALNLRDSIAYEWSLISGILDDEDFSIETFENTFAQFGKDYDLSRFDGLMNNFKKAHYYLKDNTEIVAYDIGSDSYAGTFMIDLRSVFKRVAAKFGLNDTMMNFVYEAHEDAAPFEIDFSVKLSNIIDKDYDAIVFDIKGDGLTRKFYCTNDLTDILNNVGNYAVIILTQDVELAGDVNIPKNAIIDLNGFTLTGNINANGGTVRIVDSRFDVNSAGIVEGKLTGSFILTGGKYTADVAKHLTDGYYINENGYVCNEIYTLNKRGNDIEVVLSADYLNNFELLNFQSILIDLAVDMAMSAYTGAAIAIDGNYIYNFSCEDITNVLAGGMGDTLNAIINILDVQGLSKVVNSVVRELTDFEGLARAIKNGSALVDYQLSTENWDIVPYIADGNYITFSAVPSNKETGRFTVVIDGSEEAKAELETLCHSLSVIEVNKAEINVNDIYYGEGGVKGFNVDFNGALDVHINLADNKAYAAIIVAAAAYSADSAFERNGYKGILEAYLNSESTDEIVDAIERMTVAELIAACKALNGITCAQMLTAIGIELGESTDGVLELYGAYDQFIDICAKVLMRLDVTGNNMNLAGKKTPGTYATYEFDKEFVNRVEVSIKLTTVAAPGKVTINPPAISLPSSPSFDISKAPAGSGVEHIKGFTNIQSEDGTKSFLLIDAGNDGITAEGLLFVLNVDADGDIPGSMTCTIKDAGRTVLGNNLVCTGYTLVIRAYDGVNYYVEEHTVVIAGDNNGDGKINAGDTTSIISYFKDKTGTDLTEEEFTAIDINNNGVIDLSDAAMLSIKYKDFDSYVSAFNPNN